MVEGPIITREDYMCAVCELTMVEADEAFTEYFGLLLCKTCFNEWVAHRMGLNINHRDSTFFKWLETKRA